MNRLATGVLVVGCAVAGPAPVPARTPAHGSVRAVRNVGDDSIRVLLPGGRGAPAVESSTGVVWTTSDGSLVARAPRNQAWRVEREGRRVRAVRPDGVGTVWTEPPLIANSMEPALLSLGGKPYRGHFGFYGSDSGVAIVNVARIDDYLRGVVPLEIGTRAVGDSAAVQAQAVTARSYAFTHLTADPTRTYDVTGGVRDQVYGGVAAETSVSSQAVESTRTLVLKYDGRVVNAPYHSTCGGSTAAASEIWRSADEPYLRAVSDRIPGSDRYYCDLAPQFRWTRTLSGPVLNAAIARYLATYTPVPGGTPGVARSVSIASRTASGRVAALALATDRGTFTLRGNDIRYVLRQPGGDILNSTNFAVETSSGAGGAIAALTIRGSGHGHGVGMCQSGAIGRARAGQDYRAILHTYYPGTTIGPAQ